LKESGIYDYWINKGLNIHQLGGDSNAEKMIQQDLEPLTLKNLSGVFKILLYELTLSIIAFLLGWIHYLSISYPKSKRDYPLS